MPNDSFEAIFAAPDYDPCAALAVLRPAYMRLVAGESAQKISFRDRDAWFHRGDIEKMGALVSRLERECKGRSPIHTIRFRHSKGV